MRCAHPDPDLCCRLRRHVPAALWDFWRDNPEVRNAWGAAAVRLPPLPGCPAGADVVTVVVTNEPRTFGPDPAAWPWAARLLARRRQPGDKGIGDTLAREIDSKGGRLYKWAVKRLTGGDCTACAARQEALNAAYPYR